MTTNTMKSNALFYTVRKHTECGHAMTTVTVYRNPEITTIGARLAECITENYDDAAQALRAKHRTERMIAAGVTDCASTMFAPTVVFTWQAYDASRYCEARIALREQVRKIHADHKLLSELERACEKVQPYHQWHLPSVLMAALDRKRAKRLDLYTERVDGYDWYESVLNRNSVDDRAGTALIQADCR